MNIGDNMINDLICNSRSTLIDAWKLINKNARGVAFITDNEHKLIGLITDGDIRRFLLDGGQLEAGIEKCMNTNFVYGSRQDSNDDLLKMINDDVKIIPLVNEDFEVEDYFEYRTNVHIPVATPDLKGNEFNYLTDAFLSTWISSCGDYIDRFENEFSLFCGRKYGVAVSNGTVALHLALVTLGIGKGDEVIVPDLTFAAAVNPVIHANATPVIVDIENESWCIDPHEIEKAITPKTKAIIAVHLYGQPCNMDAIMAIAKTHNLCVIEDCAEAHGAEYRGKKVGSFGDISCFSFFANKIITTGEGGMCITNDKVLQERMKVLRDHGMNKTKKYWHSVIGYNYRMTNLQAAIGLAQLERIDEILKNRETIEMSYIDKFQDLSGIHFQNNYINNRKKITWLVCALIDNNREKFIDIMSQNGIDIRPFFYSLGRMDIYKKYVFSNKNSMAISLKGVSFPTSSSVDNNVLDKIYSLSKTLLA